MPPCPISPTAARKRKTADAAEIVDAAENLYRELGWDAVTMDSVAKQGAAEPRARVCVLQGQERVAFAITERAMEVLRTRFEEASSSARMGIDQIEAIGRAYMAFGLEFPHYFDACSRLEQRATDAAEKGSAEGAVLQMGRRIHEVVVASLEAGQRDGSIRADIGDLDVTSRVLWGFTHGLTQIAITKARPLAEAGISVTQLTQQAIAMIRYTLAGTRPSLAG